MRNARTAGAETSGLVPAGRLFQRIALNSRAMADEVPYAQRTSTSRTNMARKQNALPL